MSCKIKVKKMNKIPLLKLIGTLHLKDIHKLTKKFELLHKGKDNIIIVDLTDIEYIDSHGLGLFIHAWKMMESVNKKLIFLKPQGFIYEMFESAKLHKKFEFVDNLEKI